MVMLFTKEFIILEEGDGSKMDLKEIRDLNLETIYMMAPPSNDRNKKTNKKKTFLSRHVE